MKRHFHSLYIIFSILFLINCPVKADPSKQETAAFIKDKLNERVKERNMEISIGDDYCEINVASIERKYRIDRYVNINTVYVNNVGTNSGEIELHLRCISGECITVNTVSGDINLKSNGKINDVYVLKSYDGSFIDQITRALNHLKGECKGKKELF